MPAGPVAASASALVGRVLGGRYRLLNIDRHRRVRRRLPGRGCRPSPPRRREGAAPGACRRLGLPHPVPHRGPTRRVDAPSEPAPCPRLGRGRATVPRLRVSGGRQPSRVARPGRPPVVVTGACSSACRRLAVSTMRTVEDSLIATSSPPTCSSTLRVACGSPTSASLERLPTRRSPSPLARMSARPATRARNRRRDARSTVAATCTRSRLVLIEAVTGTAPFAADTPTAMLAARIGQPLSRCRTRSDPLFPPSRRAGRLDPVDRPDAGSFGRMLKAAADDLDPPAPLPLARRRVPG